MHSTVSIRHPPRRYVSMLLSSTSTCPLPSNDIPHLPAWSSVLVPVTVVKESSNRSMFFFCYDMSDSIALSTLSRFHIYPFSFSLSLSLSLHCAVTLKPPYHVFPTSLYIHPFSYPSLHHSYRLSSMFSLTHSSFSLSRRIISVSYLCRSSPPLSVLVKVETLSSTK